MSSVQFRVWTSPVTAVSAAAQVEEEWLGGLFEGPWKHKKNRSLAITGAGYVDGHKLPRFTQWLFMF